MSSERVLDNNNHDDKDSLILKSVRPPNQDRNQDHNSCAASHQQAAAPPPRRRPIIRQPSFIDRNNKIELEPGWRLSRQFLHAMHATLLWIHDDPDGVFINQTSGEVERMNWDRIVPASGGKEMWRAGPIAPDFEHREVLPKLTRKAVDYIHEKANDDRPFFLYFPLPAPHSNARPVTMRTRRPVPHCAGNTHAHLVACAISPRVTGSPPSTQFARASTCQKQRPKQHHGEQTRAR